MYDKNPNNERKNELIKQVTPYRDYLVKKSTWQDYRDKHPELNLPHSNTLIKYLGTWKEIRDIFNVEKDSWANKNLDDIIKLLKPHVDALQGSPREWDDYRKDNELEEELPGSYPLIHQFESWNNLKKTFSLPTRESKAPHKYTVEEIQTIIKTYAPHVFRARSWERYRKENQELQLPTYLTILRYVTKEELVEAYQKWKEDN
ncbi:hypothetical protein D7X33_18345 [Butyricicoccus sp. 1XD8-22]|nr:hypothetical protein D7X33_18345 [Butyricicoccus sp. 1XD8-22]